MKWDIRSFDGMGPIRFGMTQREVAELLGPPEASRKLQTTYRDLRCDCGLTITYRDAVVSSIEAFYNLEGVVFRGVRIFHDDPLFVLRFLEEANGGCLHCVGSLLFENIGLTAGCLDDPAREQHSVVAFAKGLWDSHKDGMEPISFR